MLQNKVLKIESLKLNNIYSGPFFNEHVSQTLQG